MRRLITRSATIHLGRTIASQLTLEYLQKIMQHFAYLWNYYRDFKNQTHGLPDIMYQTITKTIVAWLFNNYIAFYYFDNININQLKVAFNAGRVELEDLPIKKDALRHLRIPWKVISGTVGKLVIQIPLLSLLTEPWDICITDLTLVVSPNCKSQMKMIQAPSESGQSRLSDYLDEEPMCNSEETKLAEFYNSFSSTVSSIVRDVFRNLRLEIKSIQIIFEDNKASITKFEADRISLTRPNGERRLAMKNLSFCYSEISNRYCVFRFNIDSCDLEIRDVAPGEVQNSYEFISDYDISGHLFIEGAPSIPVANFLLEDFRLLFYSCDQQQDGSIFARISCCHFDREKSSWDNFLEPWPFNLSWDKRSELRRFSLTSDELAELSINSSLLDMFELIIERMNEDRPKLKLWPAFIKNHQKYKNLVKTPKKLYESSPQDYKLTYYNYNTNLAQQIGARSTRQLFSHQNSFSDMSFVGPGLKATLLDNLDEKFVLITIENISIESKTKSKEQIIDCSVQDMRIENLLPDCEETIVLDRATASLNQGVNNNPALKLIVDRILGRSFGTVWFKQVQITMCELLLNIEEKLFLKFVEFISFRLRRPKRDLSRNLDKILHPEEDRISRYYFDLLRIDLSSLTLSVFTAASLPETLQRVKNILGLDFFGFEDIRVELAPYFKMNVSRTLGGIFDSVTRFYKRQISEQAPRIVGQQIHNYLRLHLSDLLSSIYDEVYNKLLQ